MACRHISLCIISKICKHLHCVLSQSTCTSRSKWTHTHFDIGSLPVLQYMHPEKSNSAAAASNERNCFPSHLQCIKSHRPWQLLHCNCLHCPIKVTYNLVTSARAHEMHLVFHQLSIAVFNYSIHSLSIGTFPHKYQ